MKSTTWMVSAALSAAGAWWLRSVRRRRRRIDLSDRVVCITGGSRGLGFAIAEELAGRGARLVLVARDGAQLAEARRRLEGRGARVSTAEIDITDPAVADDLVEGILQEHGRLDVLVNNAGVVQIGPAEHMTQDEYEAAMAVHFWAPLWLTEAALPAMRAQGGGRIVNVSSFGGRVGVPHLAPYCASKFALTGLSDALRAELAAEGVFVTTVTPGLMRTGSFVHARVKGEHLGEYRWFSLLANAPGLSIDVETAARRIAAAMALGEPSLIIGWPARLGIAINGLWPGLFGDIAALSARLLPPPQKQAASDETRIGWELRGPGERRGRRAIERYNQERIPGR